MKKRVRLQKKIQLLRFVGVCVLTLATACSALTILLLQTTERAFEKTVKATEPDIVAPFPVGVNPHLKLISEKPDVERFLDRKLATEKPSAKVSWWRTAVQKLAEASWYQNLASPISRILVIRAGERKEEIIDNVGDILRWDESERETFEALMRDAEPFLEEGVYFPEHYLVEKDATPEKVALRVQDAFDAAIYARYTDDVAALVPLEDALIIASLLEREAYDFEDMRHIAGVIWNRLFIGMNLQIDASLQYAKGTKSRSTWWPKVVPDDKYIDSPYNTYEHNGLPPTPIGNPGTASVLAALNPTDTECYFYFHDADGGFHCTPTYEEHVALLKKYYGRGR